jgi:DNA/RNA non-specific endonuclease
MINTDKHSNMLSLDELKKAREEAAETLFYRSAADPSHTAMEATFNAFERELFLRERGNLEDYEYKFDVRHYFAFFEIPDLKDHSKVKQIASMAVRDDGTLYTMCPTNKVINWRNTGVGKRADAKTRKSKDRYGLDDAGHLIGLQFGTDPREEKNLADQNFLQNQGGGTWHSQELHLQNFLDSHSGCRVEVVVHYSKDQYGRRRQYWKMNVSDENHIALNDNLVYFNAKSHALSRTHGYEQAREIRNGSAERNRLGLPPVPLHLVK